MKGVTNQSEKMETIYTQKHGNLTLSLLRIQSGKMYTWYTALTNTNNNKQLVLDSDLIKYEDKLYSIIFSYLDDKDLYVFYDKFGSVLMIHYHFTAGYTFDKKVTLISEYLCGSSFGSQSNDFRHVKVNNKIYFYLSTGQHFSDKQESFYTLDLSTSQLKKIAFDDNPKVVVAVYVRQIIKDSYETIAYQSLTKEEIDEINETKKYYAEPYYLLEVNNEEEKREKELSKYKKISLSVYPTFEIPYEDRDLLNDNTIYRDLSKNKERKRAESFIREILEFTGYKTGNKFKVLNYLYEGTSDFMDMYYFFYTDEHNQVQIIRYDMYENLWYIGGFEEVDFEPQIDIYKSPDSEL